MYWAHSVSGSHAGTWTTARPIHSLDESGAGRARPGVIGTTTMQFLDSRRARTLARQRQSVESESQDEESGNFSPWTGVTPPTSDFESISESEVRKPRRKSSVARQRPLVTEAEADIEDTDDDEREAGWKRTERLLNAGQEAPISLEAELHRERAQLQEHIRSSLSTLLMLRADPLPLPPMLHGEVTPPRSAALRPPNLYRTMSAQASFHSRFHSEDDTSSAQSSSEFEHLSMSPRARSPQNINPRRTRRARPARAVSSHISSSYNQLKARKRSRLSAGAMSDPGEGQDGASREFVDLLQATQDILAFGSRSTAGVPLASAPASSLTPRKQSLHSQDDLPSISKKSPSESCSEPSDVPTSLPSGIFSSEADTVPASPAPSPRQAATPPRSSRRTVDRRRNGKAEKHIGWWEWLTGSWHLRGWHLVGLATVLVGAGIATGWRISRRF